MNTGVRYKGVHWINLMPTCNLMPTSVVVVVAVVITIIATTVGQKVRDINMKMKEITTLSYILLYIMNILVFIEIL